MIKDAKGKVLAIDEAYVLNEDELGKKVCKRKDGKIEEEETQKDRKTERQNDRNTERLIDKPTKLTDRRTKLSGWFIFCLYFVYILFIFCLYFVHILIAFKIAY